MRNARCAVLACCCALALSSTAAHAQLSPLADAAPPAAEYKNSLLDVVRADLRSFMSARTLGILATGAAISATSSTVERPEPMARALGAAPWDGPSDMGNGYGNQVTLGASAVALMAVGHLSGHEGMKSLGFESARALVYTTALVTAMKVTVDRTRPNGAPYSFPSGHSAAAFAVAPIIAKHYGLRGAIAGYGLALATGMGRIEDRKHYLSDVAFGAAVGLSVGMAVSHQTPAPPKGRPQFTVTPSGAAITVNF